MTRTPVGLYRDEYAPLIAGLRQEKDADIDLTINFVTDNLVISVRREQGGYAVLGIPYELVDDAKLFMQMVRHFVSKCDLAKADDGKSVSTKMLVAARDLILPGLNLLRIRDAPEGTEFDVSIDFHCKELILRASSIKPRRLAERRISSEDVANGSIMVQIPHLVASMLYEIEPPRPLPAMSHPGFVI